ncbi:MAG: biotin--[acetyl-CoA-carboxylase] ligase [Candidatus Delongbacteria bacterium]|jgi:BirA family biotin operon repressor/biotin-[acetyl-CoA-carboxylase] ligase|nr:biotin--[acetyl-CoA-carboxylase] ligase [Candidatus Delongbacteria bacterium]
MNIIVKKTCDSANKEVFRQTKLLEKQEAFAMFCEAQTKGRGNGKNVWYAEPGKNLTCSLVYFPAFLNAYRQFYFSMIISIAIDDILKNYHLKSAVKWPNDILVENKKIAGVLIESEIQNEKLNTIVIGVGLNVNQDNFPDETVNAVSLKMLDINTSPETVLKKIIATMDIWYQKLQNDEFEIIKKTYLDRLTGYQTWKMYKSNRNIFKGKIIDICEDGKAIIQSEKGKIHQFDIKEVELLKS